MENITIKTKTAPEGADSSMNIVCPIRYSLNIVGGKWKLAIICALADQSPTRYGEIRRKVSGITNMMLSQSLKELETYGIVCRKQYNEIPPRVEYTLSEKGASLLPALHHLAHWGEAYMAEDKCGSVQCVACKA